MSRDYRIEHGIDLPIVTTDEMRVWCQRPGRIVDGVIQYTTEQDHKKECDVNLIIKKYDRTGLISHVSKFEARYGDLRGVDYKAAMDLIAGANSSFSNLPAEIRKRFRNSPEELLRFMEDEGNREEAVKLGLIDKNWTEASDGLGEHVKDGENVEKKEAVKP